MAQTFEEGNKRPHSSLWKECPALGRGQRIQCGGRLGPLPPTATHCPVLSRAVQHPRPAPSCPGLQPRGLRAGEGHLWWFAWRVRRGGEGRSPKWAWRRACQGTPPLLPESVPALSHPPGKTPQIQSQLSQWGREERWLLGFFFSFFLFGNKKFLGLGEILCATAVPRGSPAPPPPLPLPCLLWGERGRRDFWAG